MKWTMLATMMLGICMPMHADTVFDAKGSGTSATTLTGTADIDTVNGAMDYASFYLSNGVFLDGTGGGMDGTEYTVPLTGSDGNSWIFNITLSPSSTLVGYPGGSFVVAYPIGDTYFEIIGDLTPEDTGIISATPEPSNLVLVGTGILFAGLELRRRVAT